MTGVRGTIAERFWPKVDKAGPNGCWVWTGAPNGHGYGQMASGPGGNPPLKAHRVSWILHHGEIPDGLWVLHHCDNPPCVNPEHLYLGTVTENVADSIRRGRNSAPPRVDNRGERCGTHKLTLDQVVEIRRRYATEKVSMRVLAEEFGVSGSQVSRIIRKERWAWASL